MFSKRRFNDHYLRFKMRYFTIFRPKITIFRPFTHISEPKIMFFEIKRVTSQRQIDST